MKTIYLSWILISLIYIEHLHQNENIHTSATSYRDVIQYIIISE